MSDVGFIGALRERSTARLASLAGDYRVQRSTVVAMFQVMGRLLEASSAADPEIQRELEGLPDGYVVGFSVLGDSAALRVRKRGRVLVRVPAGTRPDLEITFKHVAHAFHVVTFQEATAQAFANERTITAGEIAHGMRFVRVLNRMQAVALPRPISVRALKAVPVIAGADRRRLVARLAFGLARGLVPRRDP